MTLIGKEAYSLLKSLALPEKPISLPYTTLKELLLDYDKYTNFECGKEGNFHKIIHQDIKNSATLLRYPNPMRTQRYADNSLRICDTVHEGEIKFGKCLFCGKFHSRNSCAFRNAKCFKCGMIGHIQSVCNTKVYSAATKAKICSGDPIKLGVSKDHLSLSTTLNSGTESHSRLELNKSQNNCEITVSNQSTAVYPYHEVTS
ncbi:unnamed protein product [Schistosoma bovis]|nr:unnamed protein product [Schistosoma bovis]